MLSVKAREAAYTMFQVFGMTQLRIKPNLLCFAGERSKTKQLKNGSTSECDCPKI